LRYGYGTRDSLVDLGIVEHDELFIAIKLRRELFIVAADP